MRLFLLLFLVAGPAFGQAYEKFKERFGRLGEQLDKTNAVYQEIAGASTKRLEQAVARIEAVRRGGDGGEKENPVLEGDGVPGRA